MATLLAPVGSYNLIAYSVAQRTEELSIRRALRAQNIDILRFVTGGGVRIALTVFASLLWATIAHAASNQPAPLGDLIDVGEYRVHIYCMGQGDPPVVVASGGFSFDWGLVQPKVALFTRI
jgi:hypothetical protein